MLGLRRRLPAPILVLVTTLALASGCRAGAPTPGASAASSVAASALYDPARDLRPLFHDAQLAQVFPDSKTLVDARPRFAPADVVARYAAATKAGPVDMKAFVAENFEAPSERNMFPAPPNAETISATGNASKS